MNRSLVAFALAAVAALAAGCGGGNSPVSYGTPTPSGTCVPAPLGAPPFALASPAAAATGVPLATTSVVVVGYSTYISSVATISWAPSASASPVAVNLGQIQAIGLGIGGSAATSAPFPNQSPGEQTYVPPVPLPTLSPNVTYSITISGQQDPNCPQSYVSSAGSFTTAAK